MTGLPTGAAGNFAPGDALIFNNNDVTNTISLRFSTPVAGAGTQVQSNAFVDFIMTLGVFYSGNNLLGSFSEAGVSAFTADNSAIFLGVRNDTANIDHLTYTLSGPGGLGIFMNQFDLVSGPLNPIPEPSTILLLATSLTGLGIARWRRHVKRK
jgi:hypothetical protein